MSYLSMGLIATLWCVFAASALSKVRGRAAQRAFADSLRPLPFLPAGQVDRVAVAITAAEAALVLGLAASAVSLVAGLPGARPLSVLLLTLAGALLAVLTTGVALAVRNDTGARCACFGAAERPLGVRHLVRNGLLLAAAAGAAAGLSLPGARPGLAGAAVALSAGAVAALILIRLDDLVDLFGPVRIAPVDAGINRSPADRPSPTRVPRS